MQNSGKNKSNASSHRLLKDKAKNRVKCLQGLLTDLQSARKECRTADINALEEQLHLMLHEWNAELNEPSPASSLNGGSFGSFASIGRLLQLKEEEDDATSPLVEPPTLKTDAPTPSLSLGSLAEISRLLQLTEEEDDATSQFAEPPMLRPDLDTPSLNVEDMMKGLRVDQQQEDAFQGFDQCNISASGLQQIIDSNPNSTNQLNHNQFDVQQNFGDDFFEFNDSKEFGPEAIPSILPNVCPPPSAFLGPKCSLWDCPRPAQGSDWCHEFCSSYHAILASNEGCPGMTPVLRPGGIWFKDGQLFSALSAKTLGKDVGIPECGGAATTRSPWNAPELFDLNLCEGETIREWLFFDKPRRAFESGNRKQRSLPDYSGRGWHESRKQVLKEFGGQKRSYYMDPQPQNHLEWHLFEYEINGCDVCALYRLELKLSDGKKSPKGKTGTNDSPSDVQKKMGRVAAEVSPESRSSGKSKLRANKKEDATSQGCGQNGFI